MISQSAKRVLERFVSSAKELLMKSVTEMLQQYYGIWTDGRTVPVELLANQDTDLIHTARMLRERMRHLLSALPETEAGKERLSVGQLIAEQAFTQLNRFCAIRMCEERGLILESIHGGYDSVGFQSFDAVAGHISMPKYFRYKWYLQSIFDELSIELPAVFDRYSPFGLIFPDEGTLLKLLNLINAPQLSDFYDEQNGTFVNFWKEDETLGWMFQYYNSLEERRKMREESNKPRNSREMAVRNQFFTPEYIVRFLTDNSLGRIWYEMTDGRSGIGEQQCEYMVHRPDEVITKRVLKEPTDILSLDPTCGSMHFGLYLYEVYEYIYMDAWDHHPELLVRYREIHTRESFRREVPRLILENNIYGCEIDPRALQIAALSLWLRAQRSYSEMGVDSAERPIISKSNLVLAEAMPGNKRLLRGLMDELDKPMRDLIRKIWDKMQFVGEAGLLIKMEKEIDDEIEYLRNNWSKVNQYRYATLFDSDEKRAKIEMENDARRVLMKNKEEFFKEITIRLNDALRQLSARLSEEEGYENALFSEDATRGFAFIELCQKRFDCIVMNPPFGEGSEHTSGYLDDNYPAWCRNLVCAFFDRMQEMLSEGGLLGALFDRTVFIKALYERFRTNNLCGYIYACADTGWNVLDAMVETTATVMSGQISDNESYFIDVKDFDDKSYELICSINALNQGATKKNIYCVHSSDFSKLPNSVIGYYFDNNILRVFQNETLKDRGFEAFGGHKFHVQLFVRLFYEVTESLVFHPVAGNGKYHHFYAPYRDMVEWKDGGAKISAMNLIRNPNAQKRIGVYYGERGDVIDGQVLKPNMFTTQGYIGIPVRTREEAYICTSFINSILSQFLLNLYSGGHKMTTYVNQIPMPSFGERNGQIMSVLEPAIDILRHYFSLDETNLEYHGLISQLCISSTIEAAIGNLQTRITADNERYLDLVRQNDDLWMDLAHIDRESDFRKTLNEYKSRRPYEELLSIDGASSRNILDKRVIAQEIVQELVGMAFGRWDVAYAKGDRPVPEFGDVFDALPFMPVVSLDRVDKSYPILIPPDGILSNQTDSDINLTGRVRNVMHYIWPDRADDLEYELCRLIGCRSLQAYIESPNGFFDYHFKRYTKSRRKAPIYWLLSSEDGSLSYWLYYPRLSKNTLPTFIMKLRQENEHLRSAINNALVDHNRNQESTLRERQLQVEAMMTEINRIIDSRYEPNHDDGVPVTSCPLVNLISHRGWKAECQENLTGLGEGEYDWSHLALSMYPARVMQKVKRDWCLALTHGLEHLCENRPRERKKRKAAEADAEFDF